MSEILNLKKDIKKSMKCLEKAKKRQTALLNRGSATITEQENAHREIAYWTRRLSTEKSELMELIGIKDKY